MKSRDYYKTKKEEDEAGDSSSSFSSLDSSSSFVSLGNHVTTAAVVPSTMPSPRRTTTLSFSSSLKQRRISESSSLSMATAATAAAAHQDRRRSSSTTAASSSASFLLDHSVSSAGSLDYFSMATTDEPELLACPQARYPSTTTASSTTATTTTTTRTPKETLFLRYLRPLCTLVLLSFAVIHLSTTSALYANQMGEGFLLDTRSSSSARAGAGGEEPSSSLLPSLPFHSSYYSYWRQQPPTTSSRVATSIHNNDTHKDSTGTDVYTQLQNEEVDYALFWQTAWGEAQASLPQEQQPQLPQEHPSSPQQPCPKVYVYNLSSQFSDTNVTRLSSRTHAFGKVTTTTTTAEEHGWGPGLLRDTVQHHVGVIFEHRLLGQPDNCYHTNDPTEADLFFVPVLLQRKKAATWASICQTLNVTALLEELDYLTPATSCQHFFVFPKGHYSSEHCQGWFTDPHPRLQNAMRLAYSDVPGKADDPDLMYFTKASTRPDEDRKRHPNLVSIPYPSSLHWPGKSTKVTTNILLSSNNNMTPTAMSRPVDNMFPAVNDTVSNATYINETLKVPLNMSLLPSNRYDPQDRQFLMSYVGSFDHGDVQVRQQIQRQCESYYKDDPTICHLPPSKIQRRSSLPSQDILIKAQSIFCLEPAGDSPWRKGVADSITFGCIPVLFSDLSDQVTPWHWGEWKARGRVLVDRQAFVQGKIDLRHLLSTIPSQLLSLLQETLQQHARQYQYSLRDDPYDAFHLTMTKMKEHSQGRMEEPGKCGVGGSGRTTEVAKEYEN